MAHKRFFYRKDKKFGPYYYESYRDENGKVKKRYLGTTDPDKLSEDIIIDKMPQMTVQKQPSNIKPRINNITILVILLLVLIIIDSLSVFYYFLK
jgi:hypothetical protein